MRLTCTAITIYFIYFCYCPCYHLDIGLPAAGSGTELEERAGNVAGGPEPIFSYLKKVSKKHKKVLVKSAKIWKKIFW
jgi:hypothetical protein